MGSGIQLKESNNNAIRNPNSTYKNSGFQYLESGIHGVESRIQDCLGFQPRQRSIATLNQPARKLSIRESRESFTREPHAKEDASARDRFSRGWLAIIGELARRVLTMNLELSPLYLPQKVLQGRGVSPRKGMDGSIIVSSDLQQGPWSE